MERTANIYRRIWNYLLEEMSMKDTSAVLCRWMLAIGLGLTLIAGGAATAQNVNVTRIQEQQKIVADLRSDITSNVGATKSLIEDFKAGRTTGDADAIEQLFSAIEGDTRAILTSISFQSDLRDALDDMRAQIDTLIARNMREPETARRDARLDRLQEMKSVYQQQYDSVGELEQRLIRRLADLNTEKQATLLDAQVNNLAGVIESLQLLVSNLELLEGEVTAVASAQAEDPTVSQ
jgi:hypothetical protein